MENPKIIIPFGNDCCLAHQLTMHNYRKFALPFDWIKSDLKNIINCIQNNFTDFLELNFLQKKNYSDNFPLLNNEEILNTIPTNTLRVVNTKYNFNFVHEFQYDIISEYQTILNKYNRRIERFINLMMNVNIQKILVNIGKLNEKKYEDTLHELFISKNYSNYKFVFLDTTNFGTTLSWKREEYDWKTFFNSL
jgi:hypothetical protein